jgi:alpha-1,6-mannosyltransferase
MTGRFSSRVQLGSVLAGGALLEAFYGRLHHLNDLKLHVVEFIALALAAGVVYLIALYFLEYSSGSRAAYLLLIAAAIAFRLTLFPLEPSLSDDLHRYRWDGRVQNHGWNPYALTGRDPRLAPLRDAHWAVMPGQEMPSIYPPAAQLVYRLTDKVLPGATGFKTPFALADLLIVLLLAWHFRRADDRSFRLAVYAWNPLVVVEFAGSGHNDALALAGVVIAVLIIRRHPAVSMMPLVMAALTKAFPAVLLPLWLRRAGWPKTRAGWLAVALGGATGALIVAPYWSGLGMLRANLTYYEATWRNYHASLYTVIDWLAGKPPVAAWIGAAVVWGLALRLAARRAEPERAAFLLFGTILLFAPNGYSWYFTWVVPFLCFYPNAAWLLLTVLQFLSYNVLVDYGINGRWHFDPFFQWLVYAPFFAMLAGEFLIRKWKMTASGPAPG